MTAFNPFKLRRPEPTAETRTFTDAAQPDAQFTVTLRVLVGFNAESEVSATGEKFIQTYITGEPGSDNGPAPFLIPAWNKVYHPSRITLWCIARLIAMQVPAEGEKPLDLFGWFAVSEVMPKAFGEIVEWSATLGEKAFPDLKNASEAPSAEPSEEASSSAAAITPNSSSGTTPSSSASTTVSGVSVSPSPRTPPPDPTSTHFPMTG